MREPASYIPIQSEYLIKNTILNFDLYLCEGQQFNLLRRSYLPIVDDLFEEIDGKGEGNIYIRSMEIDNYHSYLEENLDVILTNPSISLFEKAEILLKIGGKVTDVTFSHPKNVDNLKRCRDIIECMLEFFNCGRDAFMHFEVAVPIDYKLHTHCLNVAALSIKLAQEVGINERSDLINLGLGALLHDIGMTIVPNKIRTKSGKLTEREYMMVKKHVAWGAAILRDIDFLHEDVLIPVWEHHERIDGKGYPSRKTGDQIHIFGKIAAIAVVFDAMNTNRPYRNALTSFPALREMLTIEGAFDAHLLKTFIKMMGKTQ